MLLKGEAEVRCEFERLDKDKSGYITKGKSKPKFRKTNPSLIFKDHPAPSLFMISSPDELLSVLSESGGFLGDAALVGLFKPFLYQF